MASTGDALPTLNSALRRLAPLAEQAIRLRYGLGAAPLPMADICARLGLAEGDVAELLEQAMGNLLDDVALRLEIDGLIGRLRTA